MHRHARILVSCASTHCTQSLLTGSVLACFRYCCWLGMPNPQGKQQHKVNSHHATPFGKHLPTSQHQCCPAHARRYLESGVQTLVVCQILHSSPPRHLTQHAQKPQNSEGKQQRANRTRRLPHHRRNPDAGQAAEVRPKQRLQRTTTSAYAAQIWQPSAAQI